MMIRSRIPSCSAGGMAGWAGSVETAGPGAGWWFVTGGTTDRVGRAFPAVLATTRPSAGRRDGDLGQVGHEPTVGTDQPGEPDQHVARGHRSGEGQLVGTGQGRGGGDGEGVQIAVRRTPGPDLDGGAGGVRGQRDPAQRMLAAEVVDDAHAGLEVPEGRRPAVGDRLPRGAGVPVDGPPDVVVVLGRAVAERV